LRGRNSFNKRKYSAGTKALEEVDSSIKILSYKKKKTFLKFTGEKLNCSKEGHMSNVVEVCATLFMNLEKIRKIERYKLAYFFIHVTWFIATV
jgi:heterodisulfide reductase subunit B